MPTNTRNHVRIDSGCLIGILSDGQHQVPDVRKSRSPPGSGTRSNSRSRDSSSGLTAISNSATSPESAGPGPRRGECITAYAQVSPIWVLWGYSGGDADAIAVSIGSEPQEILPDDRAWGFAFLGLRLGRRRA